MKETYIVAVLAFTAGAVAAQEAPPGPEIQRITALLEQTDAQWQAGKREEAETRVRAALTAALAVPQLDQRDDVRALLWKIGNAAHRTGQPETALAAFAPILEYRERTLPEDDRLLLATRGNVAEMKRQLGDYAGAAVLQRQVLAGFERTLPADHRTVQMARGHLASTLEKLGEAEAAFALWQAAHDVCVRTLPEKDALVIWAKRGVARTLADLHDFRASLTLERDVLSLQGQTLAADDDELQATRHRIAELLVIAGDVTGALALEEGVCAARERNLGTDHPNLLDSQMSLGAMKAYRGDTVGALALFEKVCEARDRTLPAGDAQLERSRGNLAEMCRKLGHLEEAAQLQEQVLANLSRQRTPDHPDLLLARGHLATTREALGEFEAARRLAQELHDSCARTLADDHPDRLWAQRTLAKMRWRCGDLAGAIELQQGALDALLRTMPQDHEPRLGAQVSLLAMLVEEGDVDRVQQLAATAARDHRRALATAVLAPRELDRRATEHSRAIDWLMSLSSGCGALAPMAALRAEALLLVETTRGAQAGGARQTRRMLAADERSQAQALARELRLAIERVVQIASERCTDAAPETEAWLRERNQRVADAVATKERLQRDLYRLRDASGEDYEDSRIDDFAARLPERAVAVSFVRYDHTEPLPEQPGQSHAEARLAAFVVDRDSRIALVHLGPATPVEELVDRLRAHGRSGETRGLRPTNDEPTSDAKNLRETSRQLQRTILAPIAAATGAGTDTWFVSMSPSLQLLPLDALESATGEPFGTGCSIRPLTSLFELAAATPPTEGEDLLIGFGGIDYGDGDVASAFAPLPGTAGEVLSLQQLFEAAFIDGHAQLITGATATRAALLELAPRARYLHLATHGYFAPETIVAADGAVPRLADPFLQTERLSGLSPLVLTGLALAGANAPRDPASGTTGIVTAEELLLLDLGHCELVTLSACETSVGVRRSGHGFASLRSALQAAGARYVLTSLWKVGDAATMQLMVDFYRQLWLQKQDPHAALWQAKAAARQQGVPFRDWAGWVLTGR